MNPEDRLQELLERIESGEPLEACLRDLPSDEAALLKTAAMLRALPHPDRAADAVAAQRADLLRTAKTGNSLRSQPFAVRVSASLRWVAMRVTAWPRPVALAVAGVAVIVLFAMLLALRPESQLQGTQVAAGTKPAPTNLGYSVHLPILSKPLVAPDPQSAAVSQARGIVEVHTTGGEWTTAKVGQIITAGQRIRTGKLSGAALLFYDGSQARLGPETELAVDELNARTDGPRVVRVTQWIGESDHDVVPSNQTASRYEVNTPSGNGLAKGTLFHVSVSAARVTRISVSEGTVAATHLNVTVIIVAGQVTTIPVDAPPQEPVFRVTGEGVVTQIGATWRIGGIEFLTDDETVIVGNPQVGDTVGVEGHLLRDGSRVADAIVLLRRAPENHFAFTGQVDAIGTTAWVVASRTVSVTADTDIAEGIEVGDVVRVEGIIRPDGALRAERIRPVQNFLPFEFTGVVETIGGDEWTISGVSVAITDTTEIETGLAVGDVVKVEGHILDDGTWLADEIKRAEEDARRFEFTGVVQSIEPWVVSGIEFETDAHTEIDDAIEVGDRVKVEGRVRDDGAWLAEEIERLDDEAQRFEFVGKVRSIDPWNVGGVPIAVNDATEIDREIKSGDLVRVRGRVLADGTLLAEEIKRLEDDLGCSEVIAVVIRIDSGRITLSNGQTIDLSDHVEIEGNLSVFSVVIIEMCIRDDGTLVSVTIIVIYQLPAPTPAPVPPPTTGGKVTVCHVPGGNPAKAHTIQIDPSSVPAHLGHGDTLGACGGNGGEERDEDSHEEDD